MGNIKSTIIHIETTTSASRQTCSLVPACCRHRSQGFRGPVAHHISRLGAHRVGAWIEQCPLRVCESVNWADRSGLSVPAEPRHRVVVAMADEAGAAPQPEEKVAAPQPDAAPVDGGNVGVQSAVGAEEGSGGGAGPPSASFDPHAAAGQCHVAARNLQAPVWRASCVGACECNPLRCFLCPQRNLPFKLRSMCPLGTTHM